MELIMNNPFADKEEVVVSRVVTIDQETTVTVSNGVNPYYSYIGTGKEKLGDVLVMAVGGTEGFTFKPVVGEKMVGKKLNPPKDFAKGYDGAF